MPGSLTPALERLAGRFASLPGIGRKSALRLAYHVLEMDGRGARVCRRTAERQGKHPHLPVCMNFCEGALCPICADASRDRSVICVAEDSKAVKAIEDLNEYRGLFHILHGVISPVDGIGPDKLKIKELLARLTPEVREVILATNPSVEGEATAMYLSRLIRPLGVKVTRLAYGLPVGATLEYADGVTLLKAFEGRTEV
ncbi:MAG: recombination mediator RecR [Acutalibacteraceae bacterium]